MFKLTWADEPLDDLVVAREKGMKIKPTFVKIEWSELKVTFYKVKFK